MSNRNQPLRFPEDERKYPRQPKVVDLRHKHDREPLNIDAYKSELIIKDNIIARQNDEIKKLKREAAYLVSKVAKLQR